MKYTDLPPDMDDEITQYLITEYLSPQKFTHDGDVLALSFSPDGTKLAALTKNKKITVQEVSDGSMVRQFDFGQQCICKEWDKYCPIESNNSHSFFFEDNNCLSIISTNPTQQGNNFPIITGHKIWSNGERSNYIINGHIKALTVSHAPNDLYAYSCMGPTASPPNNKQIIIVKSHSPFNTFLHYSTNNFEFSLSPDGKLIALVSADQKLSIYNTENSKIITQFTDYQSIEAAAFSPDGSLIALAKRDGTSSNRSVTIHKISDGSIVNKFSHNEPIKYISLSPNASSIAINGETTGNLLNLYDPTLEALKDALRKKNRTLRQYIFLRTIMDKSKDTFYLNNDGHETWKELKDVLGTQFTLYRGQNAQDEGIDLWKLVRGAKPGLLATTSSNKMYRYLKRLARIAENLVFTYE